MDYPLAHALHHSARLEREQPVCPACATNHHADCDGQVYDPTLAQLVICYCDAKECA